MNPTWLYVAALYALAVWLARRCGVELRWRIAFFFYALVLIFLWRPMTQAYVNVPVDFLGSLPPWVHVQPAKPANGEINDVVLQMVPWAREVREHWKSLRLPLWNAHSASGYPLLANGQSAALSPLRILALPLPLGESFTAEAAMKLLIAMTFFLLLIARGAVSRLNEAFMRETRVDWRPSDGATLKSGPAAFWYDADKGQLVYQGALDDKRKFDLINLLILDKPDPTAGKSYWAAIDKLAYQANAYGNGLLIDLLVLGGLAGALGVQL